MDGQPFFLVNQAVDEGLLKVLENEIVPRLERDIPNQPTAEQLEADPLLHRFTLVFDREGYSPGFFLRMKEKRIACLTYHKHPKEDWAEDEFINRTVTLSSGAQVEMRLAERGVFLGKILWLREVRKLTESGHQTSILSTDYSSEPEPVAAAMFARWSQENFFKYMRENYGLDRLVDYAIEDIPDTTQVVNPEYRRLDGQIRSKRSILNRRHVAFSSLTLKGEIETRNVATFEQKKAALQEEIKGLEKELEGFKCRRKAVNRHITMAELPKEERFKQLSHSSKHLIDTIKMVAYRAETAMVQIVREKMSRKEDARNLLKALYKAEVDLMPNEKAGTLTVRIHHLANHAADLVVRHLCTELNTTETIFPGTTLRLIYETVST